jgi:hypothetical protein
MYWLSIILASAVPLALAGGLWQRIKANKGIGWQFIRFIAVATGMPIAGVLALNNLLTSEVITLIAATMGFAFGKSGDGKDA